MFTLTINSIQRPSLPCPNYTERSRIKDHKTSKQADSGGVVEVEVAAACDAVLTTALEYPERRSCQQPTVELLLSPSYFHSYSTMSFHNAVQK